MISSIGKLIDKLKNCATIVLYFTIGILEIIVEPHLNDEKKICILYQHKIELNFFQLACSLCSPEEYKRPIMIMNTFHVTFLNCTPRTQI